MTELQSAGLGYVSAITTVLIGYWLTNARENQRKRAAYQTPLRLLRASVPTARHEFPTKQLNDWWLHAIDDCAWLARLRIEPRIAEFRTLKFPRPDWDTNREEEYITERTAHYERQFDESVQDATKMIDRILKAL